jgi:hypothetical protein
MLPREVRNFVQQESFEVEGYLREAACSIGAAGGAPAERLKHSLRINGHIELSDIYSRG